MDARVKPGHDEKDRPQSLPVTRGLDPRVHHSSQEAFAKRMDWRMLGQRALRYGLNNARMRLQPSAGGVAGSGAGPASASPFGAGSSGAGTPRVTPRAPPRPPRAARARRS